MTLRRAYFECDGCQMRLHLLAPVERPCPNCGGNFVEIDDDEDYGQMDLGIVGQLSADRVKLAPKLIDKIIEDEMPEIIEGFEVLLAKDAKEKGWG